MKLAIIGGGISSLALGCYLLKNNFPKENLIIYEKEAQVGGVINTISDGGYLIETAAAFFTENNKSIKNLCYFLGLKEELIPAEIKSAKRYIYYNNRLNLIQKNPLAFFLGRNFSIKAKFKIIKNLLGQTQEQPKNSETVKEFFIRQIGEEIFYNLVEPAIGGIYAGNPSLLSMQACFPKIKQYETKHGSLLKGLLKENKNKPSNLFGLKLGMKQLIDAMVSYLNDVIKPKTELQKITIKNKKINCTFADNSQKMVDKLILATPAYAAAKLLKTTNIATSLANIPYLPLVICALGYKKNKIPNLLDGFGFLVPTYLSKNLLGGIWNSNIFPEHRSNKEYFLTQMMLGGARNPDIVNWNEQKILNLVSVELKKICNIKENFDYAKIIRWQRAIPQYSMNHLATLKEIEKFSERQPIYFHNNAYYGIGLNDCISNSEKLAQKILQDYKSQ